MKDEFLRELLTGAFVLAIVLFLSGSVSAAASSPIDVIFNSNSTSLYDEGHFTINWTSGGGDAEGNYTVYLWMNDNFVSATPNANTTPTGYTFTNSTQANYTFAIDAINATGEHSVNSSNVSMYVDDTLPDITLAFPATGWHSGTSLNVQMNATDALSNVTNSTIGFGFENTTGNFSITLPGNCNFVSAATGFNCSASFDTTTLADGNYTFWVNVTDNVGHLGYARIGASTVFGIDNTVPTVTLSKSSSTQSAIVVDYTSSDSGSGIANNTLSGSSGTFSGNQLEGLNCGTTYDVTITSYDGLGNSASSTVSMATSPCSSSVTSSGGGSAPSVVRERYFWDEVTPGVAAVAKDFSSDVGVREIQVNVVSKASNVKINVIKHQEKPVAVSVEKSGTVYQYVQISTENLENKIESAKVQFRVEKSWASQNGVGAQDVVISKFDEGENVWNELSTTSAGSDDNYYYYDVELDSFSYFAISKKATVSGADDTNASMTTGDETGDTGAATGEDEGGSLTWLWIVIAVVVLAAVIGIGVKKGRRQ